MHSHIFFGCFLSYRRLLSSGADTLPNFLRNRTIRHRFANSKLRKPQIRTHRNTPTFLLVPFYVQQPTMGNDGGSIPRRSELVKNAARLPTVSELKATALESLSHSWTRDPLSSEPLDMENVVSDWRGRLYNYESVLKGLTTSGDDSSPDEKDDNAYGHDMTFSSTGIRSLRDIVRLRFKRYQPAGTSKDEEAIWACPVSLKELGPATRAVYVVPCGHVFAEVAIREITDQEHVCPECSEAFEDGDVISILPTDETELVKLRKRMEDLRAKGLSHSKKAGKSAKKNKKRKAEDRETNGKNGERNGEAGKKTSKSNKTDAASKLGGINNPATASLTAKVLAEQEQMNKRRKLASVGG